MLALSVNQGCGSRQATAATPAVHSEGTQGGKDRILALIAQAHIKGTVARSPDVCAELINLGCLLSFISD